MAENAPDARAQSLANKLRGNAATDDAALASIIAGATEGGSAPRTTIAQARARKTDTEPVADPVDEDDVASVEDDDEDDDDDIVEGGDTDDDDDESEDESDDEEEDDDEGDGDAEEFGEYDDEDTLEVVVDGKTEEVSLRELKRVYSLQGATTKRLQEATEERKAAKAERAAVVEEQQATRTNMLRTIQQLDGVLFAPLVSEPDPKLRTKNMQEYLLAKDAWEEDQKRIKAGREELTQFLGGEQKKLADVRAGYREEQRQLLVSKMPELNDPQKATKIQEDIMGAAGHYGFTPELVAQVDHHGLFLMARDAARWLNMQKLKQNGKLPTSGEPATRRKRHLKAGNGTGVIKANLVKKQREQKAAETTARRTGKVDDVASMILSKARRRN